MARSRMPSGSLRMMFTFVLFSFAFRIQAQNDNNNKAASTTAGKSSQAAQTADLTNLPNLSAATTAKSSSASSSASASSASGSGTSTSASVFKLTGLPTLAGAGIPTVIVPDTAGAPYMQKSTLPEGTVFICVGAALGFLGAAVLAWRGLVAWLLHRSVKRAAMAQNTMDSKALLRGGGGGGGSSGKGMYSTVGANSTLSLDHLASPNPRTSKYQSSIPSAHTKGSQPPSNLFFSPTAGAGLHSAANRSSSYLPAGYYAPGSSAPGNGAQMTNFGGSPSPLSTGQAGTGYARARSIGTSPPSSPHLPPSRGNDSIYARSSVVGNVNQGVYNQQSVSSLNLTAPPQQGGRTPSAYLEDLFENHGNGPRERF